MTSEQLVLSLPDKLETFYQGSARYAVLTEYVDIDHAPLSLGDSVISSGQFVQRLGRKNKSRATFEMQDDCYLRYVGKHGDFILFAVNDTLADYCYAFGYINATRLLVVGNGSAFDIILDSIDIYDDLPIDARKFN
ncbi:hypothetical protein [Lysinibacillus sp. LZ02]|uniref:hypothetical protein n=1 Tax=Lysinibacillus sp. LZ02 TaxID=3420668 RepID=UPI003D362760